MLALALLSVLANPVSASTDEAWEAFRAQVRDACLALAGPGAVVETSLFGSDSYGAALVVTRTAEGEERSICIWSKATGVAEITTPLSPAQ